jgi:hypothetical protein
MLISEDDPADMRVIAEKATRLITMHVPKGPDSCTTVAADEDQEGPILWQPLRELGIRRLRIPGSQSRRARVIISTSASKARTRPPASRHPCVFTTTGLASSLAIAKRAVPGQKTRLSGHYFGYIPRLPIPRYGQFFKLSFPGRHGLCLLYQAVAVSTASFWTQSLRNK